MPIRKNRLIDHLILMAGTLFMLAPVVMVVLSSTHPGGTLARDGLQLSLGDQGLATYTTLLTLETGFAGGVTALAMLKNSAIVGLGVAALTTIISLLTAYSIVFLRFRWSALVFWMVFVTLMFPLESRVIPTYAVTSVLGLTNTHLGIVLPALATALGTFFFRQYFLSLPDELAEAAKIDGAGPLRFLVDFIVPMSWAQSGAIFVIAFMIGWNQYMWPLMISSDERLFTLIRGLQLVSPASATGLALTVLTILPPLVLLILFQRTLVGSLARTGTH